MASLAIKKPSVPSCILTWLPGLMRMLGGERDTHGQPSRSLIRGQTKSSCTRRANQEEWYTHLLKLLKRSVSFLFVCLCFLHQNVIPASVLKDWLSGWTECSTEWSHVWSLSLYFFFLLCEFGLSDGKKWETERQESRDRREEVNAMRRLRRHLFENKCHDGYKEQMVNVSSLSWLVGCKGMNSFVSLTPLRLENLKTLQSWRVSLWSALHYGTAFENNITYAVYYYVMQYFYTTEICLLNYLNSDRELKDPTSTGCIIPH